MATRRVVKCDNHPDRKATVTTDGRGAFQPINLCQQCSARVPVDLRTLVDVD